MVVRQSPITNEIAILPEPNVKSTIAKFASDETEGHDTRLDVSVDQPDFRTTLRNSAIWNDKPINIQSKSKPWLVVAPQHVPRRVDTDGIGSFDKTRRTDTYVILRVT